MEAELESEDHDPVGLDRRALEQGQPRALEWLLQKQGKSGLSAPADQYLLRIL
jgi:hypothetical protein